MYLSLPSLPLLLLLSLPILSIPSPASAATYPTDSSGQALSNSIQTYYLDPRILWQNRALQLGGVEGLNSAVNRVVRIAGVAATDETVYTVTNSSWTASLVAAGDPSSDPHDFFSLAANYWPTNLTADGLPYVANAEGLDNPEAATVPDPAALKTVIDDVWFAGLAFFWTGNATYADVAARRVRQWFLDEATAMNPNFDYANWIMGRSAAPNATAITANATAGTLNGTATGAAMALIVPASEVDTDNQPLPEDTAALVERRPRRRQLVSASPSAVVAPSIQIVPAVVRTPAPAAIVTPAAVNTPAAQAAASPFLSFVVPAATPAAVVATPAVAVTTPRAAPTSPGVVIATPPATITTAPSAASVPANTPSPTIPAISIVSISAGPAQPTIVVVPQKTWNASTSPSFGSLANLCDFHRLLDGIALIRTSSLLTQTDQTRIDNWLAAYLEWLQTSARGLNEASLTDYRGVHYDGQEVSLLLFLNRTVDAATVIANRTLPRISTEIGTDGRIVSELMQRDSWSSSVSYLESFFILGHLARNAGSPSPDVFTAATSDGRSVRKAVDFLLPYALANGTGWPVTTNATFDVGAGYIQILKEAYVVWGDTTYLDAVDTLQPVPEIWNPSKLWTPFAAFDVQVESAAQRIWQEGWSMRILIGCLAVIVSTL
ncbi:hypothetical protein HKX48_006661 [Thoreauomyces humboldtii]|nr:hypothetical protein HKX48_006661 [Thoreauomyces humboldtii]